MVCYKSIILDSESSCFIFLFLEGGLGHWGGKKHDDITFRTLLNAAAKQGGLHCEGGKMWKNLVLKVEKVILCNPTRSRPFMTCIDLGQNPLAPAEPCLVASAQETWPWPNPGMPKHRNIGGSLTSERVLAPLGRSWATGC